MSALLRPALLLPGLLSRALVACEAQLSQAQFSSSTLLPCVHSAWLGALSDRGRLQASPSAGASFATAAAASKSKKGGSASGAPSTSGRGVADASGADQRNMVQVRDRVRVVRSVRCVRLTQGAISAASLVLAPTPHPAVSCVPMDIHKSITW